MNMAMNIDELSVTDSQLIRSKDVRYPVVISALIWSVLVGSNASLSLYFFSRTNHVNVGPPPNLRMAGVDGYILQISKNKQHAINMTSR